MKPFASFPMYARPELQEAHGRLWSAFYQACADRGFLIPKHLSQDVMVSAQNAPFAVLSQTCGMPFRMGLKDYVHLVGTPDYGLEECEAGYYRSAIIVREDEERDFLSLMESGRVVVNSLDSQSGYAALLHHAGIAASAFTPHQISQAHRASALAVAEGQADMAALDAVSWRLMARYDGFAARLKVLEWTVPTPGLPLVTGRRDQVRLLRDGVREALEGLSLSDREALGLYGLVEIKEADYCSVPNP